MWSVWMMGLQQLQGSKKELPITKVVIRCLTHAPPTDKILSSQCEQSNITAERRHKGLDRHVGAVCLRGAKVEGESIRYVQRGFREELRG